MRKIGDIIYDPVHGKCRIVSVRMVDGKRKWSAVPIKSLRQELEKLGKKGFITELDIEEFLKKNDASRSGINHIIEEHNKKFIDKKFHETFKDEGYIKKKNKDAFCNKFNINGNYENLYKLIKEHNAKVILFELKKIFDDADYITIKDKYEYCRSRTLNKDDMETVTNYIRIHNKNKLQPKLFEKFEDTEITEAKIQAYLKELNVFYDDITIDWSLIEKHNTHIAEKKLQAEKDKLQKEVDSKGYISIAETKKLFEKHESIIDKTSLDDLIEKHNHKFYEAECVKYKDIFEQKGYELNDEQKKAVITDEDNSLVIAGAGCGKTRTVLGKINYLIHKGVDPKKILVLSYTKKTVEDLNKKLAILNTGVKARTFHSLGCEITGERYYDNITIGYILRNILDSNQKNTVQIKIKDKDEEKIIKIENTNNIFENIKKLFLKFIAYTTENKKDVTDTTSNIVDVIEKCAIRDYETQSFPTLKSEIEYFEERDTSIKGEHVKSLAEVKIANFLFMNSIDYTYEDVYKGKGEDISECVQYRPDFHIKSGEKEIWLEHFGVTTDEQGNKYASWCSEEEKYLQQMEEKIIKYDIKYTTSDMLHNGTLLDELKKILEEKGIQLNPISDEVIREYLDNLLKMQKYQMLIDRVERAISLFKAQNRYKDIPSWKNEVSKDVPITKIMDFQSIFLIISNVYDLYQKALSKAHSVDFNDMIAKAINIIEANQISDNNKYDYILVDEYQDITNMRYEFIKALKKANDAKVLAVGDDWQSIYGFSGSNIALFTEFKNFFDDAQKLYLTQTYRNPQQLLNVTREFIKKNKAQISKTLSSYPGDDEYPIKAVLYHQNKKDTDNVRGCDNISNALARALDDILTKKKDNETVCIIGRYNITTPNKYYISKKTEDEIHYIDEDQKDTTYKICYQGKNFDFTTIHKAKGLEWDYTIFLDGLFDEEGKNSFPCALPDDYIVKPLLNRSEINKDCADTYPFAEERRMLYVALTRCRKQCYWLISEEKPTPFYEEKELKQGIQVINDTLEEYCKKTGQQLCPLCHNGIITQSEDNKIKCSNYPSCNCSICAYDNIIYLNHEKLSCGSSRAIIYNSKNGKWFVGCANWSKCTKKQECNEKYHNLDRHYSDILDSIKPQITDAGIEYLQNFFQQPNNHKGD